MIQKWKLPELLNTYNLAGNRLILLGRIEESKGYDRAVKAFLRILKTQNTKIQN